MSSVSITGTSSNVQINSADLHITDATKKLIAPFAELTAISGISATTTANVGIANAAPAHHLSVGSKFYVNDDGDLSTPVVRVAGLLDADRINFGGSTADRVFISDSSGALSTSSNITFVDTDGKLTVSENITSSGTANVAGLANVGSFVSVGTSNVGGASNVNSTLDVTGAATMGSITSHGAATLESTLALTGAATLSSTANIAGASNVNNTLDVTNAATVGSLTSHGAATLSSTANIAGASNINSTLDVTSAATLGSIVVHDTATLQGVATFTNTTADNALIVNKNALVEVNEINEFPWLIRTHCSNNQQLWWDPIIELGNTVSSATVDVGMVFQRPTSLLQHSLMAPRVFTRFARLKAVHMTTHSCHLVL